MLITSVQDLQQALKFLFVAGATPMPFNRAPDPMTRWERVVLGSGWTLYRPILIDEAGKDRPGQSDAEIFNPYVVYGSPARFPLVAPWVVSQCIENARTSNNTIRVQW